MVGGQRCGPRVRQAIRTTGAGKKKKSIMKKMKQSDPCLMYIVQLVYLSDDGLIYNPAYACSPWHIIDS